jgi:hypothetical protein
MERFAVKRGLQKKMGGSAGLAKIAAGYFDDVNADAEGKFTGSYGILLMVSGHFDEEGKLAVDVSQMKGAELGDLLESDGGREIAMESRKRWSTFLDEVTGYNAKQRSDKAKEDAKKFSKAKGAIKVAQKTMEMSKNMTPEKEEKVTSMIDEIQQMIDAGTPPSEGKVKKLNDMF